MSSIRVLCIYQDASQRKDNCECWRKMSNFKRPAKIVCSLQDCFCDRSDYKGECGGDNFTKEDYESQLTACVPINAEFENSNP